MSVFQSIGRYCASMFPPVVTWLLAVSGSCAIGGSFKVWCFTHASVGRPLSVRRPAVKCGPPAFGHEKQQRWWRRRRNVVCAWWFGVVFSGGFGGFRGADHEGLGSGISVKIGIWLSP